MPVLLPGDFFVARDDSDKPQRHRDHGWKIKRARDCGGLPLFSVAGSWKLGAGGGDPGSWSQRGIPGFGHGGALRSRRLRGEQTSLKSRCFLCVLRVSVVFFGCGSPRCATATCAGTRPSRGTSGRLLPTRRQPRRSWRRHGVRNRSRRCSAAAPASGGSRRRRRRRRCPADRR